MESKHKTVLLQQSIKALKLGSNCVVVDATLGGGGHSLEIINNIDSGKLICIDLDLKALNRFESKLIQLGFKKRINVFKKNDLKIILVNENFKNIESILTKYKIKNVDAVIIDLGLSLDQILEEKGFSYKHVSDLDMRLDKSLNVKASDLLNVLYKKELEKLFKNFGDIAYADKLANAIIKFRNNKQFENTTDLVNVVRQVVPLNIRTTNKRIPEARVFQALRIAVNNEYENLHIFLNDIYHSLNCNGRLCVLTFHSGEDAIVKSFFKSKSNKKSNLIKPVFKEIQTNPQSRSAKLRVLIKNCPCLTKKNLTQN